MEVRKYQYSNKQEAIKKLPEQYYKSFYFRPDGDDRGWKEEYHEYHETWDYPEFSKLLERCNSFPVEMIVIYLDNLEVTIMIVFEQGPSVDDNWMEDFRKFLIDDIGHTVIWGGIDYERIVIMESF